MQRYKSILIALSVLVLMLNGCGKTEPELEVSEPVQVQPPLHEMADSVNWDNLTIKGITPVTAFESSGAELTIFPYYDNDNHIIIEKIITSKNAFWDSVLDEYSGSNDLIIRKHYSYVTTDNGTTIGLLQMDDYAYTVKSSLPSYYVDAVLSALWQSVT